MGTADTGRQQGEEVLGHDVRAMAVRRLLAELGKLPEERPVPDELGRQVVLDIQVDGVRCLLIRYRNSLEGPQMALSPRELEVARMVAQGYPNKAIGMVLDISSWTVSTHLRRIFAKLGVPSRAAMVARLLERGMIGGASAVAKPQVPGKH
jgi:DNA-binding CsgD family transcriptional regulator